MATLRSTTASVEKSISTPAAARMLERHDSTTASRLRATAGALAALPYETGRIRNKRRVQCKDVPLSARASSTRPETRTLPRRPVLPARRGDVQERSNSAGQDRQ